MLSVSKVTESGQTLSARAVEEPGVVSKFQRPDRKNGGEHAPLFNRSANQENAVTYLRTGGELTPIARLTVVHLNRAPHSSTSAVSTKT